MRIIRNILSLRQIIKDPSILKRGGIDEIFGYAKNLTKLERKYVLKAVLSYRKIYPYVIQDYSEAKDLYEDYFKLDRCINSLEELKQKFEEQREIYITRFRKESPVKGARWCEYFINKSWDSEEVPKTYKVDSFVKDFKYFIINYNRGVDDNSLTSFRYATEKEIKDFKRAEIRKASIQQRIKQKEEEIKELKKLIND